jgi:hypothetical protein
MISLGRSRIHCRVASPEKRRSEFPPPCACRQTLSRIRIHPFEDPECSETPCSQAFDRGRCIGTIPCSEAGVLQARVRPAELITILMLLKHKRVGLTHTSSPNLPYREESPDSQLCTLHTIYIIIAIYLPWFRLVLHTGSHSVNSHKLAVP